MAISEAAIGRPFQVLCPVNRITWDIPTLLNTHAILEERFSEIDRRRLSSDDTHLTGKWKETKSGDSARLASHDGEYYRRLGLSTEKRHSLRGWLH
jgi:hypothetical protein